MGIMRTEAIARKVHDAMNVDRGLLDGDDPNGRADRAEELRQTLATAADGTIVPAWRQKTPP